MTAPPRALRIEAVGELSFVLRGYLLPELARRKCCLLEAGEELVSKDTTYEARKEIALGNLGI